MHDHPTSDDLAALALYYMSTSFRWRSGAALADRQVTRKASTRQDDVR